MTLRNRFREKEIIRKDQRPVRGLMIHLLSVETFAFKKPATTDNTTEKTNTLLLTSFYQHSGNTLIKYFINTETNETKLHNKPLSGYLGILFSDLNVSYYPIS